MGRVFRAEVFSAGTIPFFKYNNFLSTFQVRLDDNNNYTTTHEVWCVSLFLFCIVTEGLRFAF